MTSRPLRVLHCPTATGGNPQSLAKAERRIGLLSHDVVFEPSPFGYRCGETLFSPSDGFPMRLLKRALLLRRALRDYDVIHFNFGQSIFSFDPNTIASRGRPLTWLRDRATSFLRMRDLPLLRRAGKVVVFSFQGDDIRQSDYCLAHQEINFVREIEPGYYTKETDEQKRAMVRWIDRYADALFGLGPDLMPFLPARAELIPTSSVELDEWLPPPPSDNPRPLVVHAPSHRGVKGTRYILEALDRLRAEGVDFDLQLVEKMTRVEARRTYERADMLVDQLLGGFYGGLAVEAMALAKPVVVYIRESELGTLPPQMRAELPVIQANPATILPVLREWLGPRRHELAAMGRRARAYVEQWHDPLKIAARFKARYEELVEARRQRRPISRVPRAPSPALDPSPRASRG